MENYKNQLKERLSRIFVGTQIKITCPNLTYLTISETNLVEGIRFYKLYRKKKLRINYKRAFLGSLGTQNDKIT